MSPPRHQGLGITKLTPRQNALMAVLAQGHLRFDDLHRQTAKALVDRGLAHAVGPFLIISSRGREYISNSKRPLSAHPLRAFWNAKIHRGRR